MLLFNTTYINLLTVSIFKNVRLSKSHAKRFCRCLKSLSMGFTFLMDANTSKYFYNYFMGMKQTLISKISGIERLI